MTLSHWRMGQSSELRQREFAGPIGTVGWDTTATLPYLMYRGMN